MRSIFLGVSKRAIEMLVLFSVSTCFDRKTGIGHAELEAIVFYFCICDKQESEMGCNTFQQVFDEWGGSYMSKRFFI